MKRIALIVLCTFASAHLQASYTQTLTLEPGWNAVYLEVVPEDNDIETVFAGVPLASVWRFISTEGAAGIPDNPSAGLRALEGWHAYYPPTSPASPFSDLFTVRANTAYLIELAGSRNVTVTLTGTPQLTRRLWAADAFTFSGFGVDPGSGPQFATYFATSAAHRGQAVYTLNDQGEWEAVDPSQRIESGKAYWVYSRGSSDFQGPLEVALDPGFRELDFGPRLAEAGLTLINRAGASQQIHLTRIAGGQDVPLEYEDTSDPQAPVNPWLPIEDAFPQTLEAVGSTRLVLAPRRSDLQVNGAEQVLALSNLEGARVLVSTSASLPVFDPALPTGTIDNPPTGASAPRAGLWIGVASINKVNQTQSSRATIDAASSVLEENLLPVAREWPLRLIVHVDGNGDFTLVSQVVQLFEEGSTQLVPIPDSTEFEEQVCVPGRTVLITQDENFSDYKGLSLRGDDFVGERISTLAYDFGLNDLSQRKRHEQALGFIAAPRNAYQTVISLASDSPSNPFFHPFHPDHDNRDEFFIELAADVEVPEITRTLSFNFCDSPGAFLNGHAWDPASDTEACGVLTGPQAETDRLAGKFEDQIAGLHKNVIYARGNFELRRFTTEDELNPQALDLTTCCSEPGVCP